MKRRAAAHGRSTEEEHRQLLRQVLRPEGLATALLAMPDVGDDTDFERQARPATYARPAMGAGFLLDTNVVSELRKGARADAGVRTWFEVHITDQLWLSVLVVGELRRGVELLRRREYTGGQRVSDWLTTVTTEYGDRVIPVTTRCVSAGPLLDVPDPIPVIGGLFAATRTRARLGAGDAEHC